jgi:integrase
VASARSARDRLLILVLASGIRTTEIVKLTAGAIYADQRGSWIKVGGKRGREVPIPDSLRNSLEAYVSLECIGPRDRLFTGFRGTSGKPGRRPALTRSGVSQALATISGSNHVAPRAFFDMWLEAMAGAHVDPRLASRVVGLSALTGAVGRAYARANGPLTREDHDVVVKALPFD